MKMYQLEPAVAVAEAAHLRVARRTMTTSQVASPNCGDSALQLFAAGLHSIGGPIRTPLPTPARKGFRQPRIANIVCAKGDEGCELFLAELEARRVRPQKLLKMVGTQAEPRPAGRAASRYLASCENGRGERTV